MVERTIVLDTGPIGLVTNPNLSSQSVACNQIYGKTFFLFLIDCHLTFLRLLDAISSRNAHVYGNFWWQKQVVSLATVLSDSKQIFYRIGTACK